MRHKIVGFLAATALSVCGASAAIAADMPTKAPAARAPVYAPAYNWTGWYLGLNGGGAWGTATDDNPFFVLSSTSTHISGAQVGGQLGYNWQSGNIVLGIETDMDWSNVKGTSTTGICTGVVCTFKNTWLGTTRARLGYAMDRWLPFITAGVGYGNINASDIPAAFVVDGSKTKAGFAGGGGLEAALVGNWTAKVEYLYVDLGHADFACTPGCGISTVKMHENIVRAGVNYRF